MAGLINIIYTVAVVLVAGGGVLATLLITPSPRDEFGYASMATAIAVALFVVAVAVTLVG